MNGKFSGYVLAGGKSSRMGADKAFLQIGGETFLTRAADLLAPFGTPKIVVNRAQSSRFEHYFNRFEFIFDIYPERGALGAVHAALADCESEFAVILAVDLPLVSRAAIESLTERALSGAAGFAALVPRQSDGRFQPLCAVYRVADCLPAAEKLLTQNASVSMRRLLDEINVNYVADRELSGADDDLFFNVNLPEDFKKLESVHFTTLK